MSQKRSLSRRDFLRVVSLATAGSVLAACAPKMLPSAEPTQAAGNATQAPPEPTPTEVPAASSASHVVYWTGWPDTTYGKIWEALKEQDELKEFLAALNITLEVRYMPEEGLLTALAGGVGPDGGACYNYMDYMSRDVLTPLDDYITSSQVVKKADFLEPAWNIGVYNGKNYGLPANECFVQQGFCYNAVLVKEAGLDPDMPPETWDDLLVWSQALTKFDDSGNVKVIGYNPADFMCETIWGATAWDASTSWGFNWYDEAKAKFNFNNEEMVDYFRTVKKFMDLIGIDKLTAFAGVEGQGGWGGAYFSKVQASMIDGYWLPGEMTAVNPDLAANTRYSWIPVPSSRKGVKAQGLGGHIVMVFKDTKNQDAMYKISEWLTTKTPCDTIFNTMGWLPARLSYLESVDPKTYNGLEFFLKSAKEATYWGPVPKCPITSYVGTTYPQIREQVFRGVLTPEAAAEEFQNRCDAELINQGFGI